MRMVGKRMAHADSHNFAPSQMFHKASTSHVHVKEPVSVIYED